MLLDKRHALSRKITKWTSPLLKLCAQGQSWTTQCYVMAMRSITRAQALELKKFCEIYGGKRGWHLNLKHLVVVEAIFSDVIQLCRPQAVYDLHLYCRPWKIMFSLLQFCVFFVTDGDTLCQNISEFLCSSLAVSLAQTGSCLFILCCLEGLATLAEKIPSLTRWR